MGVYTKKAYSDARFGFSRLFSGVLPREHIFLQHVKCLVSESAFIFLNDFHEQRHCNLSDSIGYGILR